MATQTRNWSLAYSYGAARRCASARFALASAVSESHAERGERVTPLELFFDLVFVFAFTQVTTVLSDNPTWSGLGHGLLILGALWWAWAAYAWLTNTVDPEIGLGVGGDAGRDGGDVRRRARRPGRVRLRTVSCSGSRS